MTGSPFVLQTRVPFVDTDATGRIHFTSMFRNFEAAENEFRRALGFPYGQWREAGISFPRVHAECDYAGAVNFDDVLRIEVTVERVGRASYTLAFDVSVGSQAVARGKLVIACMDKQTQRATALPEEFAAALRKRVTSAAAPASAPSA